MIRSAKLSLHSCREHIVYIIGWLLLFLAPVLVLYIRTQTGNMPFNWHEIVHVWGVFAIFLAAFIVHDLLLAPLLVYAHRRTVYILTTCCMAACFFLVQCSLKPKPDDFLPSPHAELRQPAAAEATATHMSIAENRHSRPPHAYPPFPESDRMPGPKPPLLFGQTDIIASVMMILMLGMNLGVKYYFKTEDDRKQQEQLQTKSLEQQLEYLKYQINPHFFMNTLNNIHALVDIDPEQAKDTIVKLSKLMRYVLYEASKPLVSLERERQFIQNYISLMKIRYADSVTITEHLPAVSSELMLPPLLFITFVENAFKHGVSYQHHSYIRLALCVEDETICFSCANSIAPRSREQQQDRQGGVGLKNVRKRLDLIYGNAYSLLIDRKANTYSVDLRIPYRRTQTEAAHEANNSPAAAEN